MLNKSRKFMLSFGISILWAVFSMILAQKWFIELANSVGYILSAIIILGIAIIPGFINQFLVTTILFNRTNDGYEGIEDIEEPVTILIPIHNEEEIIFDVLTCIHNQDYKGHIKTIVINNNSKDNGVEKVKEAMKIYKDMDLELVHETTPGKNYALNKGLSLVETKYVITLDGDTILHNEAVKYIVGKIVKSGEDAFGVAGSLLSKNPSDSIVTKMQQWDYYLSITSVKRMQSAYDKTLVCQGAFSIYNINMIRECGGFSDAIGEDIVLTWNGLAKGYKTYFEPKAIGFTDTPVEMKHFITQRSRWARGLIEGLRDHNFYEFPSLAAKMLTLIDVFIMFIDLSYTLFWIPGIIAALFFHCYLIVGIMSLLVLPVTILSFTVLGYKQVQILKSLNINHQLSIVGFILFILTYQMIMSPTSLYGYIQEVFKMKRVW